jgi:expansin (peptidoglycan-binding protein)
MTDIDDATPKPRHLIRWLIAGGATIVVAAVVGIVLVLQSSGSAACAAPPVAGGTVTGSASYYSSSATGNCGFGPPADGLYAALGPDQYSGGAACGSYLDVTGPAGTVRVKVIDSCPACHDGKLDLSKAAFQKVGSTSAGVVQVTYTGVRDPGLTTPITLKSRSGSSLQLMADNVGVPLASMEVNGAPLQRGSDNYWTGGPAPNGPLTVHLKDVYGRDVTIGNVTLKSGETVATNAFLKDPPPSPSASESHGSGSPSAVGATTAAPAPTTRAAKTC